MTTFPVDPVRLAVWQQIFELGRAGALCDEIVRNRPVPHRLLVAIGLAQPKPPRGLGPLTARQVAVLRAAADGLTEAESANRLGVAPETVKSHRGKLLRSLGARNVTRAVAVGYETGILNREEEAP